METVSALDYYWIVRPRSLALKQVSGVAVVAVVGLRRSEWLRGGRGLNQLRRAALLG
jgi:hypothetical protein